jgi:uncharacterized protein (DUF2267 family)
MSVDDFGTFTRAAHTAHGWLREVAQNLDTPDRRVAYRALRAWLHTLRDRLSVDAAADFAAGLPEMLRGVFYDGWQPGRVPVKFGPDEYRVRFAREAGIPIDRVDATAGAVTAALRTRLAAGQLDSAVDRLPHQLRRILRYPVVRRGSAPGPAVHGGR